MKIGVIPCGALGEKGIILEKAMEEFTKKHSSEIISFSATIVGTTPKLLSISGITSNNSLTINSCKKKCSDIVLKKEGITPAKSVLMDDILDEEFKGCEVDAFEYSKVGDEIIRRFTELLDRAFNELK